ncbi:MAG: peptidoglycan recognition family protein [Candidatus Bipolaricaulis sp.]|nr:peptidoglycan recognition family protein [Candidatus Bipolaricaulis sp.]
MVLKTTIQFQNMTPWARNTLRDFGAQWYKWINPGGEDPCPEVPNKLTRFWTDDIDKSFIIQGRVGGSRFVREYLVPRWGERRWATAFELANEPGCNTPEDLANLREYSLGAMEEADARGMRLCVLNISEGNPGADGGLTGDAARASERWKLAQLADVVKYACLHGHLVGMHAYHCPSVEGPTGRWHALGRIVWDAQQWVEMGVDVGKLQIIVNEFGIDGGIAGGPGGGWHTWLKGNAEAYIATMVEAETYAQQFPWMKSLMYFVAGNIGWESFDIDEYLMRAAAGPLRAVVGPMPVEVPVNPLGPDPNVHYWHSDRGGMPIRYIVVHGTEGSVGAARAWFSALGNPYQSSSHIIISEAGELFRIVPDVWAAHHAGYAVIPGYNVMTASGRPTPNANRASLGVELECPAGTAPTWPVAQMDRAVLEVRKWVQQYGIPRENVFMHKTIDPARKTDPRNFDWNTFLDRVFTLPLDREKYITEAQRHIIPLNRSAALYKYITSRGWEHVSPEYPYNDASGSYICQIGYSASDDLQHICRCKVNDWATVLVEHVPNTR